MCENLYGDIIFIKEEKQKDSELCDNREIRINKSEISEKVAFDDYTIKL